MCGTPVCQRCATFAYGRYFCSTRCGVFFYHGDSDEAQSESEEGAGTDEG